MVYQINPILIEIAEGFKKAHTSEPDSVAAIALMIALIWRTDKEPYLPAVQELTGSVFYMPEKLALKLHPFLMTQGNLLGQLTNDIGFYGGVHYVEEVLEFADEVNTDYSLKTPPFKYGNDDWEWADHTWPQFTFIKLKNPQSINYLQIKLSQS